MAAILDISYNAPYAVWSHYPASVNENKWQQIQGYCWPCRGMHSNEYFLVDAYY